MSRASLDRRAGLGPPQFGLRTLLLLVAACGVLCALERWLQQPIAVAALVLFAASIFCHVAGNAIGTRLRQIGDLPEAASSLAGGPSRGPPQAHEYAPATQLSQRQSLGWLIVVATCAGTLAGGIGGGLWTLMCSPRPVELMNVGVGVVAFAVLGGIAAFTTVGFVQVTLGAIWQAMKTSPALPTSDASANEGRN